MAMLRRSGSLGSLQQRDPQELSSVDSFSNALPNLGPLAPPTMGGNPNAGGPNEPGGNAQSPIERRPSVPPTPGNKGGGGSINTPPVGIEPIAGGGKVAFPGQGSTTISPPSVTQPQPFPSLRAPNPESMVFAGGGGSKLGGNSGGQFGGGLSLGGEDTTTGGAEDPSALIMSLLQLLGNKG